MEITKNKKGKSGMRTDIKEIIFRSGRKKHNQRRSKARRMIFREFKRKKST